MGKEITDVCTGEEANCTPISSAFENPERIDSDASDSYDQHGMNDTATGNSNPHALPMILDPKEGDTKEDIMTDMTYTPEQELPCIYNLNLNTITTEKKKLNKVVQIPTDKKMLKHHEKLASKSTTLPQPFALATDKRASGNGNKKSSSTSLHSQNLTKKDQGNLPLISRKPLGDDDSCSIASSTAASVKTTKGRTTAASAPTFKSSERAEKRREFYSKLEEKHQALEAEKNQYEARTKEEREAALKQLRKSMTFKATPMPSFYNEGPPAKVELKKLPATRAKSPKFGRRKSCGDTANTCQVENNNNGARASNVKPVRHSLGTYRANKQQSSAKNVGPICNKIEKVES